MCEHAFILWRWLHTVDLSVISPELACRQSKEQRNRRKNRCSIYFRSVIRLYKWFYYSWLVREIIWTSTRVTRWLDIQLRDSIPTEGDKLTCFYIYVLFSSIVLRSLHDENQSEKYAVLETPCNATWFPVIVVMTDHLHTCPTKWRALLIPVIKP